MVPKSKTIVIVSEFFYPNKTSTGKVLTELAEDFVEYGLNVEIVTSRKLYEDTNELLPEKEIYKNIKIRRIWSTSFSKDTGIGRLINYASFTLSALFDLIFSNSNKHILFVSNPPIAPIAGYFLNILKGQEYSYLIHDLYPDIAVAMKVVKNDSLFVKLFSLLNKMIFSKASKIFVLGKDMRDVIIKKNVLKNKIHLVPNWADEKKIIFKNKVNTFSEKEKLQDKFVVLYTGNIGRFHELEVIIEAANLLRENKEIKFVFVGEGFKKGILMELVEKYELANVSFFPYQDEDIYNDVLGTGDLLVSSLEKGVEGLAVPSKTYSYLAAGKPILGIMSNKSEIGSLIIENDLGLNIEDLNPEIIAEFIKELKENRELKEKYSKNSLTLFNNEYKRNIVTRKFFNYLIDKK